MNSHPTGRGQRKASRPRRIRGRDLTELLRGLAGDPTHEAAAHMLAACDLAADDAQIETAIAALTGGLRRSRRGKRIRRAVTGG